MTFPALLELLLNGTDLTFEQAGETMDALMAGGMEDAQVGGFLIAMRAKGATAQELAGFASAMTGHSVRLGQDYPNLVDTCGTGGGPSTFNLSTGAAILAAAAGAKVAKHGNRAVTSRCGSADVLEALGVGLGAEPELLLKTLERVGIVFLFAPNHHPAMRFAGPARKALGVRTVFNQLGPLSNPAGAKRQLVGVYDLSMLVPMAEALNILGAEKAFVVHSEEGMDEISPSGRTFVAELSDGRVTRRELCPADFGMEPVPFESLTAGRDIDSSSSQLLEALSDPKSPRSMAIVPNAAAALYLAGVAPTLIECASLAREAVANGAALRTLKELVAWTS